MKLELESFVKNSSSPFFQSLDFSQVKCLVVCRGPIRKEAIELFNGLGCQPTGILLSEKDSIIYRLALAPELRMLDRERDVHRVPDYMGVGGKQEKMAVIQQIIDICRENGYTHVFAGYGFMAEDAEFIGELEKAGVGFAGPRSSVMAAAGAKDEAKKIARELGLSVTPGVDNITGLTLMKKVNGDSGKLESLLKENGLEGAIEDVRQAGKDILDQCEAALQASYRNHRDLISIEEIQARTREEVEKIWKENPGYRIRLKYIGGGGGKGQRIIREMSEVDNAVMEVLSESKVTGVGDNKTFLIELNIESTRHNEIQVVGNGKWSIALGGRDCSLQMHEQKLVEISQSREMFDLEINKARQGGNNERAELLEKDKAILIRMEEEAEKFGQAVGLNSASTFECIVDDNRHYFMEMNTRIQVEHRVSEMVYSLKFTNPENKDDYFIMESLVATMMLIAIHGEKLKKPELVERHKAGGEIRLNATNKALKPHAGGILTFWSEPLEKEIRDDQGIGIRNPDTDLFIKYNLAGAYDSNAALTVTYGKSREELYHNLVDILRQTHIVGIDVETNLSFQQGIVAWFLGQDVMARPTTGFTYSWLAAVGALQEKINSLDINLAYRTLAKKIKDPSGEAIKILTARQNLILRPVRMLTEDPHLLAGWLGLEMGNGYEYKNGKVTWLKDPVTILDNLYWYLNLEDRTTHSPQHRIWPEDKELLEEGRRFYADLLERDPAAITKLNNNQEITGSGKEMNELVRAAHNGHSLGLEMLAALVELAAQSEFLGIHLNDKLGLVVPDRFKDKSVCEDLIQLLAPPPEAPGDKILSWTGGTFYACEQPGKPPLINEGDHFEEGQSLGILEVMKMFNKIAAPFAGTVKKVLVDGTTGQVVAKGQPLFQVEPDYQIKKESPEERQSRIQGFTSQLVEKII